MYNETYVNRFMTELGLSLKKAREECGLSLEEGARKTEHSIAMLQEIERGAAEILSVKSISRIFNMFTIYGKRLCLKSEPYDPVELQCSQINSMAHSLHNLTEKIARTANKNQEKIDH